MISGYGPIFGGRELSRKLAETAADARQKVLAISETQFTASSDTEIANHVFDLVNIVPLQIFPERATMDGRECIINLANEMGVNGWPTHQPNVPGIEIPVLIPFTGSADLWQARPEPCLVSPPYARIHQAEGDHPGQLELISRFTDGTPEETFKAKYEEQLHRLQIAMKYSTHQVQNFTSQLRNTINVTIAERRKRISKLSNLVSSFNLPLVERDGTPEITPIQTRRKLARPLPATPSSKAEAAIAEKDYVHILGVIRHEGRSFETKPDTFAMFSEPQLRDVILAHLNGHYQGTATGEQFRGSGKTDICIEEQNRAAFVAECKVWSGKSDIEPALMQLLDYLTWRDCKCCLIVFNKRNSGFKAVQDELIGALRMSTLFLSDEEVPEVGEWRLRFRSPRDDARIITVHVFCFDIASRGTRKSRGTNRKAIASMKEEAH